MITVLPWFNVFSICKVYLELSSLGCFHNNDGVHDSHQRIFHGTLDFPLFLSDYQRLTPNADLVLEYSPNVADDESGIQEDISWLLEQIRR